MKIFTCIEMKKEVVLVYIKTGKVVGASKHNIKNQKFSADNS